MGQRIPAARLGEVLHAADVCLISQHEEMFDLAIPYKIYAILAAGKPAIFLGNPRSDRVPGRDAGRRRVPGAPLPLDLLRVRRLSRVETYAVTTPVVRGLCGILHQGQAALD